MSYRVYALAGVFLVTTTALAADKPGPFDWPQWRGSNRDGVSKETGLMQSWPKSGPPKVWTAKNLGFGFGTPSVACGKVFGMGTRDGKDGVWALNEADGKELWFTPIDTPRRTNQNNGPASTPTYHAGKLYVVTSNGKLACIDATSGKELWSKSYVEDYGGRVQMWGYCESPLIDGDKLIGAPGGSTAAIVALKPDTGELIWKTEIASVGRGYGYSSPIKATVGGIPMYIALLGDSAGFVGVHADTGKVLWQYNKDVNGTGNIPTPIVQGDLMWCATGYPPRGGAALLKLIPEGKDKVSVKELQLYPSSKLMNHHGGMVLVKDHVYFGHEQNQGQPVCVEFKSGKIVWGPEDPTPAGTGRRAGSAAVLYADNRLYFRYQNGIMVILEANPKEMKVVSQFTLPEPDYNQQFGKQSWPHPVIANGKMYLRDQRVLYCYNVKATTN